MDGMAIRARPLRKTVMQNFSVSVGVFPEPVC